MGCRAAATPLGTPRPRRSTAPKLLTPTWLSSWLNPGCLERREKSGDAEEVGFSESQSRCCPPVALHLQRQVSGSPGPGTAHRVRAQGRTLSGLLQTPEVPLPAPPVCLLSYLSAEKPQRPLPASKRITFPLDLNFLVLTVPEKRVISLQPKPFKHSFAPTSPNPPKSARVKSCCTPSL